jgi:hypothetical protein
MWSMLLVLACSEPPPPAPKAPAKPTTTAPYEPKTPLELKRAAVKRTPKDAQVRFDLAVALADVRAAKRICEEEAWLSTVVEQASAAVVINPAFKEKVLAEPKLEEARSTLEFWQSVEGGLDDTALAAHLPGIKLHPPAAGVYGDQVTAIVQPDGKLTWRKMKDTEHPTEFVETPGTWDLHGRVLALHDGDRTVSLIVGKDLHMATSDGQSWRDMPSECEA